MVLPDGPENQTYQVGVVYLVGVDLEFLDSVDPEFLVLVDLEQAVGPGSVVGVVYQDGVVSVDGRVLVYLASPVLILVQVGGVVLLEQVVGPG
jgi:hypothetical protein